MNSGNNLDANKTKTDEKLNKNIAICNIAYLTLKGLSYEKINSVNPLLHIIDEIDGYIYKSNVNKYLTLVPTDESKDTLKNFKGL